MDIQEPAVAGTKARLEEALPGHLRPQLTALQGCHAALLEAMDPNVAKLICFNLGYLPSGDKSIITTGATTTAALTAAMRVLAPGGLISILAYIGHPGGLEEYEAVQQFLTGLPAAGWTASEHRIRNRPTAPVLLLIQKHLDKRRSNPSS
ncbi:hypothetical protein WJX72_005889 [[Myrmecia] bisecta]|uniref:SAM-dependent methyltransferase n=1 Tax=[Myrmecia] bisecta TaxID=41462 RepID=A0AAW1QF58_9CHLO